MDVPFVGWISDTLKSDAKETYSKSSSQVQTEKVAFVDDYFVNSKYQLCK